MSLLLKRLEAAVEAQEEAGALLEALLVGAEEELGDVGGSGGGGGGVGKTSLGVTPPPPLMVCTARSILAAKRLRLFVIGVTE